VSIDGQVHVVLRGTTNLLRLPADGSAPMAMLSGTGLLAPTIDRFNWTWTGEQLAGVGLVAVSPDGALVSVHADWLSVATVRSIAVSRDGSRIAVVSRTALDRHPVVQVAAVLRDEDGRPQGLGAAVQVGSSMTDATQVEWANETTLAVLGLSGSLVVPSAHLVPVGGQSSSLPPVDGAVTVAAGLGVRAIYLADDDGTLFMRQGSSWTAVASGVRDPVFPG
jgi:hypothetical protein